MARLSEKNPYHRTKEVICRDVTFVLAREDLHEGTKFAVVAANAFWVWSEFDGKHRGCKYWSKAALKEKAAQEEEAERQAEIQGVNFKANRVKLSGLIHEHLVPKREIWKELRKPGTRTIDEVRRILTDWCIGVVVTKEEDTRLNKAGLRSKMPDDWDHKDPWARYKTAGIAVDPEPNGTC